MDIGWNHEYACTCTGMIHCEHCSEHIAIAIYLASEVTDWESNVNLFHAVNH